MSKKKFDYSNLVVLIGPAFVLVGISGAVWEECGAHFYGVTPQDLETMSLSGSPKQLNRQLSNTTMRDDTSVTAKFKKSAGSSYESVKLSWSQSDLSAPNEIDLQPEREAENGQDVIAALSRRFHAMHNGSVSWGETSFNVSAKHGDASFKISGGHAQNPLFDRQLEAGREVLLNAAFGTPLSVSDREIQDVLGSGYKTADVAKLDTSVVIEDAGDAVKKLFPIAQSSRRDSFEIPLDHPLLKSARFDWTNRQRGELSDITLSTTDAYMTGRSLLAACLTQKLGAPRENVTDYAAGKTNLTYKSGAVALTLKPSGLDLGYAPYEAAGLAQLFVALDACRDSKETTGSSRDEKK
jgi:hypothetical protein